jgi:hypothetical protein
MQYPRGVIDREHILAEIRRTAAANGGVALGRSRFEAETGIREADWSGRYWVRWGDAVAEAGVVPNRMTARFDDGAVLAQLATVIRRIGRMPTNPELRMARKEDPAFPSHNVFGRFGSRRDLACRLVAFCRERRDYGDVLAIIEPVVAGPDEPSDEPRTRERQVVFGEVYLLRVGKHYKIGQSNAFGRRERELAIQLPQRAQTVHVIKTDDPVGIEAYWHRRFADRRGNGEWFNLTAEDVAAFRRRKFM